MRRRTGKQVAQAVPGRLVCRLDQIQGRHRQRGSDKTDTVPRTGDELNDKQWLQGRAGQVDQQQAPPCPPLQQLPSLVSKGRGNGPMTIVASGQFQYRSPGGVMLGPRGQAAPSRQRLPFPCVTNNLEPALPSGLPSRSAAQRGSANHSGKHLNCRCALAQAFYIVYLPRFFQSIFDWRTHHVFCRPCRQIYLLRMYSGAECQWDAHATAAPETVARKRSNLLAFPSFHHCVCPPS